MLRPLEMLSQEIRNCFETEFEYSFFDNEARKMLDQEMKFLSSPDRKNLAEVLYRLHQAVSAAPNPVVVFQGMYQMVLVPYILGLSQYNPFEPENCHREEHICNPRYVDLSFHLSMSCYFCKVVKGNLTLSEHLDAKWLTKKELQSVDWLPADTLLIPKITQLL